ncbi:EMYY motif lipoprotein [Staphylococcus cohnii]|uniref:EMYY motif lipoprotein n=2 Tax=Staphylococcus cohnii TaxID=29382 RepID=A0A2T4LSR6_9STAP|nr:EMYY motif lipoprotein [Staphylococcus cohnii]PTF05736.1 EMYY motif lipoprotein [Staphylococcus cohnii]PTF23257.1 EMYY motif lipoprotein [Staphylococcus cohnii]PTF27631.1 EMYY motif lipoprotein [Staphylococcus cohnii]PTF34039.1 EMYY motif lipoprotein [Staphylococcus cohnii]PTF66380.1 EMYY motif lipoprotein [Staphylococcus cohnii]
MKKLMCFVLLVCFAVVLVACGHEGANEFKDFDSTLTDVKQKEKEFNKVMDSIDLENINDLSKTDMTDKNKKEFNQLQNNLNSKLTPKLEAYEKSTKHLPANSEEIKELKSKYLASVKKKKAAIEEVKTFVDLYNQAVKANEDILDYTKLFEKNRSEVEENMKKANNAGESVKGFKEKLEQNNKDLKNTAEKESNSTNAKSEKQVIETQIMPLIKKQIKDLNKAEITDGYVNDARKNTIEMYYSLQNYYETREETIEIGEAIAKIDINKLPKESEDLKHYDKDFNKRYAELKEKYQ